jgi:RNA polymerase sigma-70 factor (ECF subfamily)
MHQLTDEILLARIKQDDKSAYKLLVERYLNKIWRVSFNILNNRQDAEDVTQEVFITVWNHRTEWGEGEAKFSTWLYRVAFNKSIDFKRRQRQNHVELDEEIATTDQPADSIVSDQQTHAIFMECLKELPEKQMLCLLLYYYEELDIPGICDKLQTTEDSVRSLLKRGRQNLKGILRGRFGNNHWPLHGVAEYLRE